MSQELYVCDHYGTEKYVMGKCRLKEVCQGYLIVIDTCNQVEVKRKNQYPMDIRLT